MVERSQLVGVMRGRRVGEDGMGGRGKDVPWMCLERLKAELMAVMWILSCGYVWVCVVGVVVRDGVVGREWMLGGEGAGVWRWCVCGRGGGGDPGPGGAGGRGRMPLGPCLGT